MKRILWILIIILISCSNKDKEIIIDYVNYSNQHNLKGFKDLLSDSIKYYYLGSVYNKEYLINNFNKETDTVLKFLTEIKSIKKVRSNEYTVNENITDIYSRAFTGLKMLERDVVFKIQNARIIEIRIDSIKNIHDFIPIRLSLSHEFELWMTHNIRANQMNDVKTRNYEESLKKFALSFSIEEFLKEKTTFIEFLKNYHDPELSTTMTLKDIFNKMAGIQGSVTYNFFHSPKYPDNKNIGVVEVLIDKKKKEKFNTFTLQYQINIQNEYVELSYGEIDDEPKSIMEIVLTISLLEQYGLLNI